MNCGSEGQFPEWMTKIESRQGYCLFLSIDGIDYKDARLEAAFYDQDIDGLWCETIVTEGRLRDYSFDENNNLLFHRDSLDTLYDAMFKNWANDEEVTTYLTWPPHGTVDVTKEILKQWVDSYKDEKYYQWAIVLKEIDEPIGSISAVGMQF